MRFLTRPKALALAAASSVIMVLGLASPADATLIDGTGDFSIFNENSNKCLGISNGLAGQWTCSLGDDQNWHWGGTARDNRYRQLVNWKGQCLAVNGGSTADGARILGYRCTATSDQYWRVQNAAGFDVVILNYKSDKLVGVSGGSMANGAAVVQWTVTGAPNQLWS